MDYLKKNYLELKNQINKKAHLLIVSKTRTVNEVEFLYQLGHRDFGENRVEDLIFKSDKLPKDINWHFIGNIQSKKISKILSVKNLEYVHSVSSMKSLEKFGGSAIKLFLQINTSGESEKSGFSLNTELIEGIVSQYPEVIGLMTMGRIRTDNIKKDAKKCFRDLKDLRDAIKPSLKLSMGMSSDFDVALETGTDWLRIGSYLFRH